jgi:hypothetical protein
MPAPQIRILQIREAPAIPRPTSNSKVGNATLNWEYYLFEIDCIIMEPTPEQLRELYISVNQLTAQLKCLIRLIDIFPNRDLYIVIQPRQFPDQRMILYINPNGDRRYV